MRLRWIVFTMFVFVGGLALAEEYPPYAAFEDQWTEYLKELAPLSPSERRARSTEYLSRIPWDQALYYCREAEIEGREEDSSIYGMLDTRLRLGLGEPQALVELISDPDYCLACQKAAIKFMAIHRDSILALPESRDYGRAMLKLADSGKLDPGVVKQLEQAAAALCDDDGVMTRMMDYSRSSDPYVVLQSVQMLGGARDPRAADSLEAVALSLIDRPEHRRALGRAVSDLSVQPGAGKKYFDFIYSLYQKRDGSYSEGLLRASLAGMARTGNPRFYGILLNEYDDGETGIVGDTHALEDPELKRKYWNLWFFSRLAEPGMIPLFQSDAPEAFLALEVLDRESRFGLSMLRETLLEPLDAWGVRRGGEVQARVSEVIGRFRSYPDPRRPPTTR